MGIIPSLFRATPRSLTQITRFLVLPISGTYDCAQKLTCTRRVIAPEFAVDRLPVAT
jgi:hypothetical protein